LGPGHQLLMTRAGALDLLGTIEGGADYERLRPDALALDLGFEKPVLVLSARRIIALKADSTHPKDLRTVGALRAVLSEEDPST